VGLLNANLDERAFDSLLEIRGELVTFRDESIRALINRQPMAKNPPGSIEISTLIGSIVQLPKTLPEGDSDKPKIGESIQDDAGYTHEFTSVRYLRHCWECVCEVH
jgi:hypothetical protein